MRWGSKGVSGQPYRVSEDEIESLLSRIDSLSDSFRKSLNSALDKSEFNNTRTEEYFNAFVKDFEAATDSLKSRYKDKDAASDSAEEVLRRAKFIDEHMRKALRSPPKLKAIGASCAQTWTNWPGTTT